jgi:hypothetical protein
MEAPTQLQKGRFIAGLFALCAVALSLYDGGSPLTHPVRPPPPGLLHARARGMCGSKVPRSHSGHSHSLCGWNLCSALFATAYPSATMHLLHYALPGQQRHVVRIMLLVPLFAGLPVCCLYLVAVTQP